MEKPNKSTVLAAIVALIISFCCGHALADSGEPETLLISRGPGADGPGGNRSSYSPSASADGRYVAFMSYADNLHPDVDDNIGQIWVRDRLSEELILVSRGAGPDGIRGNYESMAPAISADGRYVTFMSRATNIHPDKTECQAQEPFCLADIFVRDLQTDELIIASRASGEDGEKGAANAWFPQISGDGRFVVFFTDMPFDAADPGDDPWQDVYLRDLHTHQTLLVSRVSGEHGEKGNLDSVYPSISADGRYVVFTSYADNLDPDDNDFLEDVYVRDLQTHETTLISRASGVDGAKGNNVSLTFRSAISADGRYIAFTSTATNIHPEDPDNWVDVYVRDMETHETILVSRAGGEAGEKGDNASYTASISADGRLVAFGSQSANLHPDKTDNERDVFVRNLDTHNTILVSRASGHFGVKGDASSDTPILAADGDYVVFDSFATNLHPDADPTRPNVFIRDVSKVLSGGPELIVSPPVLDFGEVAIGTTSSPMVAVLQNIGGGPAEFISFSTSSGPFTIVSTECFFGITLQSGESCETLITFEPGEEGSATSSIFIATKEGPWTSTFLDLQGVGIEGEPQDLIFHDRFSQ